MSQDISQNNRRIAKNTIALYIRTFITMIVGLYTGRVMLQALGVDNYGINAAVGGIVGMSSLITSTMSQAISRYITFAIGKGDNVQLKKMFSTAINAQIVMAILVALVLEILGVWFLNNQANIPEGRMTAANWVLQCGIASLSIQLISSPFSATIIAHEKMGVYAYTSIIDAGLRLAICFIVIAYSGDRLILFVCLQIGVAVLMQAFYGWYCGKNFDEAHYSPKVFDIGLMKELTIFSGWNILNNCSYVFATQGVNMLVNVFFGVLFNASRSIAITVNGAVQSFVANFTMAFTPQITKSYAAGDVEYSIQLVNRGTKFSWLMMLVFLVPVCVEAEALLKLWLGDVPDMAALFLRFAMFESLTVISGQNLYRLIQSDGRIKHYTTRSAVIAGLIFPLSWLVFYFGAPVWATYLIFIVAFLILNIVRGNVLKRLMGFSMRRHLMEVFVPCMKVSVLSFVLPLLIIHYWEISSTRFFVNIFISILWTLICSACFGLSKAERQFVVSKITTMFKR